MIIIDEEVKCCKPCVENSHSIDFDYHNACVIDKLKPSPRSKNTRILKAAT